MNATILDNAIISEESIVGANSLITAEKVFPLRSLIIKSPAKVVRELSKEKVQNLIEYALGYVEV